MEAGAVLPGQETLPGGGEEAASRVGLDSARSAEGEQAEGALCALPQGRILLGPEGVPLRRVDVLAANGVIHMLEGILLPPTILPILPKLCNEEQHAVVTVSAAWVGAAFQGEEAPLSSPLESGWLWGSGVGPTVWPGCHTPSPQQSP